MTCTTRICIFIFLISSQTILAQSSYWPKEIPLKTGGKILIYQPQPDELNGNILQGKAAVSAKANANDPAVYGAIFFEASLSTDKDTRRATLESIKITNTKMEGVDDKNKLQKMVTLIETEVPNWHYDFSLDQLIATMKRKDGNGKMYNKEKLCVPTGLGERVIGAQHIFGGHLGVRKLVKALKHRYIFGHEDSIWKMAKKIKSQCNTCQAC